jgi:large subunit ribosomal protein L4
MSKILHFNAEGKKLEFVSTPSEWGKKFSPHLLAQAMHVYQDRRHPGNKKTKTRAEVDITKRKIYKQKGTGGARHGASSAPIFVGGGTAHGPKSVKRVLTLPQTMRNKAMLAALSQKVTQNRIVAVDDLMKFKKTKEVAKIVEAAKKEFGKANYRKILFVPKKTNKEAYLAMRNIQGSNIMSFTNLNAYDLMQASLIIMDANLFETPKKRVAKKTKTK